MAFWAHIGGFVAGVILGSSSRAATPSARIASTTAPASASDVAVKRTQTPVKTA